MLINLILKKDFNFYCWLLSTVKLGMSIRKKKKKTRNQAGTKPCSKKIKIK